MLVFIKLALCVVLVEIGVALVRRVVRVAGPRALPPAPPAPPLRLVAPPPRVPPHRATPPPAPPPAPAPAPEGVDLSPVAMQPVGAQCRVCANGIEDGLVSCSQCEAPHHADCWQYNGGCSTYGCRSGVARPAP